jgi:hypothetical protein
MVPRENVHTQAKKTEDLDAFSTIGRLQNTKYNAVILTKNTNKPNTNMAFNIENITELCRMFAYATNLLNSRKNE